MGFGVRISINANHSHLRSAFGIFNTAMHTSFTASPMDTQLPLTLERLASGESGSVMAINVDGDLKKRFFALGLKEGAFVRVLRRATFGGPIHLRVGTSELILRRKDACCVCLAVTL
jgi:ferrous iron transport protein A